MKVRKAKKEVVKKFQKKVDEFFEKVAPYAKKVVTVIGVVAAGASVVLLTGCSSDDEKPYYEQPAPSHRSEDTVAERESLLEKDLAKYLSEETGQKIEIIDMKDVKLVNSSGYYLVISGEFMTDAKEGTKECSVTLKLTEEQYKNAEEFLKRYYWYKSYSSGGASITMDDVAAHKFSPSFIEGMHSIIDDENTQVVAIYDKDNKEWVFDAEEPVVSNKR